MYNNKIMKAKVIIHSQYGFAGMLVMLACKGACKSILGLRSKNSAHISSLSSVRSGRRVRMQAELL